MCPAIYHPGRLVPAAGLIVESWHPQEKPAALQLTNQYDKNGDHVHASHFFTLVQKKQICVTIQRHPLRDDSQQSVTAVMT